MNKKEKTTKPNYTAEMQKLYLEMFLSDAETFVRCQTIFDPLNFDQRFQDIASFVTKYVDDYKVMPEVAIVNAACRSDLQSIQLPKENQTLFNPYSFRQIANARELPYKQPH